MMPIAAMRMRKGAPEPYTEDFLASATITVPAGFTKADITVTAGGGGGGYRSSTAESGGGGGGERRALTNAVVTSGEGLTGVVGAGGAGRTVGEGTGNGVAGGLSSISRGGTLLAQANGGSGGGQLLSGGAGGTGGSGGTGTAGNTGTPDGTGASADTPYGNGGYGGSGSSSVSGGNGASGRIRIYWHN